MQMANRFFSGLLHPFIHTGYGAEFGLLGMFAEGRLTFPYQLYCTV